MCEQECALAQNASTVMLAPMLRSDLYLAAALCCGCTPQPSSPTAPVERALVVVDELPPVDLLPEEEAEPEVAEEEVVRAVGIPVSVATGRVAMPYRSERYAARCRTESRRDAPEAETMESKSEARDRARGLVRADQLDELLLLSRIAYGETGTPQPGVNDNPATPTWDEVDAFLAVLDGRRGSMSRAEMFVSYSPRRVFPHPEDNRQRWVAELLLDGSRPPSWPRPRQRRFHDYPPWRSYGCPRWLATVDAVRRVLQAHPRRITTGPCERTPDHWGGEVGVDDHVVRLGWHLVDCGLTRNRFWLIPEHVGEDPPSKT